MCNAVDSHGGNFSVLEDRIETLISYFSDELLQGDIYDFYYMPGEGVHKNSNGCLRGLRGVLAARYNRKLSENRAKATRDYLQQLEINPQRIKTKIYGSDQSSETAHQMAEDRRIEFKVEEREYRH